MFVNWLDIVFTLLIIASMALGWQRGFVLSSLDLIRWIGSWVAAIVLYRPLSEWFGSVTGWEETWRAPIAFLFILIIAGFAIQAFGARLIADIDRGYHTHKANRAFGMLPGFINGVILTALLSAVLYAIPLSDGISQAMRESVLANSLTVYTNELEEALAPVFEPALRQTLNRLTVVQPGSDASVELPFKVAEGVPMPELEAQMLEMVNRERAANALDPVEADPEMTVVARMHSADMFARGYFSHYTPERKDPFQRMRDMNVRFRTAGENLALAPTLEIAHTGLMNSPGHRANILSPNYGRLGIGILKGGRHGMMVTQKFRN